MFNSLYQLQSSSLVLLSPFCTRCSILRWDEAFWNAFSYFDLSEKGVVDIHNTEFINALPLLSHQTERKFGTSHAHLFASISILAIGDMYQLPLMRRKPVLYMTCNTLLTTTITAKGIGK